MSITNDGLQYKFYDFTKSIYLFSHMKTNLVDPLVQDGETIILNILIYSTYFIYLVAFSKIIIVIAYFLIGQAFLAFLSFIKGLYKNKCSSNWKIWALNVWYFLKRIIKKLGTFNFYIFENRIISVFLIGTFIINLVSNTHLNAINLHQISSLEKENDFITFYFLSFEFNLYMEIILFIFYSHRNLIFGVIISLGYFLVVNLLIIFIYLLANKYEYLNGVFINEDPQRILNIILFSILMILKINCLYKVIKYNPQSK